MRNNTAGLKRLIKVTPIPAIGMYSAHVEGFESQFGNCSGTSAEDARRSMELYLDDCRGDYQVLLAGFGDVKPPDRRLYK